MKQNRILLTGYKKANDNDISSTEIILKDVDSFNKFLFTNDFDKIIKEVELILKSEPEFIIMFGWKPAIKKINIEILSKNVRDYYYTNFDIGKLLKYLRDNKIDYQISEKAGNSYCNFTYFQVLKYIKENNLKTKAIFIHIPSINNFVQKNEFINVLNVKLKETLINS